MKELRVHPKNIIYESPFYNPGHPFIYKEDNRYFFFDTDCHEIVEYLGEYQNIYNISKKHFEDAKPILKYE